jgi:hypothetical protein
MAINPPFYHRQSYSNYNLVAGNSGFQYLDSRSTKFQDLQLTHTLKMETTLSISFPIHFEAFPGMGR